MSGVYLPLMGGFSRGGVTLAIFQPLFSLLTAVRFPEIIMPLEVNWSLDL